MRYAAGSLIIVAATLSAACLQQETTHTVYLSPDGAVTWMSIERDIRSDARAAADRVREEQEFLDRAGAGSHPIGLALQQLGPDAGVRTRLLRRERPYAVLTEARYARLDGSLDRMLLECGLRGFASITRTGETSTLELLFTVPDGEADADHESPVMALADADAPYRVVLTEGRFVSGEGFIIDGDGAVAVFDAAHVEDRAGPGQTVRISLSWAH
jgi:hypothetical protein